MSNQISGEMGEHVFTVDFSKLKSLAAKIKPEVFQSEIVDRINKYSNDKNELKLSTIIDFTNEIAVVKETLFSNEDEDEGGGSNNISRKSCEEIIEYLENFVSHKVFNVKPEDMEQPIVEEIKKEEKAPSVNMEEQITKNEDFEISKTLNTMGEHLKNYGENENKQIINKHQNTSNGENISVEDLKSEMSQISENLEYKLSELYKNQIDPKIEQLEKTWKNQISSFIQKSENDKKLIETGLDNIKIHVKNSNQDLLTGVGQKVEILLQTIENYTKSNNDIIVNTIKIEMDKSISENKIKAQLDESHVRALNGVKTSVIFSLITALCAFTLCLFGIKWYSNSAKYENIVQVQKSLPPYEQDLFNQIITKGYANTKDNPRNR